MTGSLQDVLAAARSLDGVLELAPGPGSDHPEISWGDHFFYVAPDGLVPTNRQPYATVVTKDYPDDAASALAAPNRWRLNLHVGQDLLAVLVGAADVDPATADAFFPHPLYGPYGWVSVINPGPATLPRALAALRSAHEDDRRRVERRAARHRDAGT